MTEKKITYALTKIRASKQQGHAVEALLKLYHLNLEMLRFIFKTAAPDYSLEGKKVKGIVNDFLKELDANLVMKTLINKRSVKSLKPWLSKMDVFFKSLKLQYPKNINALHEESEKIYGILKISANKIFVKKT